MIAWIINIILLYIEYLFFSIYFKARKSFIFSLLAFLHLSFLLSFKDNSIFSDIPVYIEAFEISKGVNWNNLDFIQHFDTIVKLEYGWVVYTKIVSVFLSNSEAFLVFTGVFIIGSYLVFIKKFSVGYAFSTYLFIVFIFYNSLFVLRQHFAVAVLLYSIPAIISRRLTSFIFLQLIAFSIHQSSLIFFPMYFIYGLVLNKRTLIILLISSILLSVLFKFALSYIGNYLILYQVYSEGIGDLTATNFIPFSMSFLFLIFIFVTQYTFLQISKLDSFWFIMILLIVVIDYNRIGLTGTLGRLNFYFYPALIVLLPKSMDYISNIYLKGICYFSFVILLFILMINGMSDGFSLSF